MNQAIGTIRCVAALLALLPGVAFGQYVIEPSAPRPNEAVRLSIPGGHVGIFGPSPVSMSGNRITVVITDPHILPSPLLGLNYLELGRFPVGVYDVEVFRAYEGGPPQGTPATLRFTVTGTARGTFYPNANFTDLWWDPAESGWGLGITQHVSDALFATWFVYGADGKPIWYVLPGGTWTYFLTFTGPVYKTTGPYYGGPFNPAAVTVTQAGTATLTFTEYDRATFTYTIDGVTGTKTIRRQPF